MFEEGGQRAGGGRARHPRASSASAPVPNGSPAMRSASRMVGALRGSSRRIASASEPVLSQRARSTAIEVTQPLQQRCSTFQCRSARGALRVAPFSRHPPPAPPCAVPVQSPPAARATVRCSGPPFTRHPPLAPPCAVPVHSPTAARATVRCPRPSALCPDPLTQPLTRETADPWSCFASLGLCRDGRPGAAVVVLLSAERARKQACFIGPEKKLAVVGRWYPS